MKLIGFLYFVASLSITGCIFGPADEVCNNRDDDGDGFIDEDFNVGASCDGEDSDLCGDGALACHPSGFDVVCADVGEEHVELCNAVDDDCDGDTDEDFDFDSEIENCGGCGLACTNRHGTTDCAAGGCDFTCDAGAEDCNADPYDGCEVKLDADPLCDDSVDLGSIPGDIFGDLTVSSAGESWLVVFIDEVSTANRHVSATIELESPEGMNFDLFLYCATCGSDTPIRVSELPGDQVDVVDYGRGDRSYVNDGRAVFIEVRHVEGVDTCATWTLRVTGGTDVFEETCSGS